MMTSLLREVFDAAVFADLGRRIFSRGDIEQKTGLHSLLFAADAEAAEICRVAHLAFWNSRIPDRYRAATGHNPLLLFHNCTIRYQKAMLSASYVGWHLDANFYGFDVPLWTVWAPFVPVGQDASGLEFSVSRSPADRRAAIRDLWRELRPDSEGKIVIAESERTRFHGAPDHRTVSDRLAPGDAFVFDQYALHRTQVLPGASRERLAIEYRVISRDRAPADIKVAEKRDCLVSYRDGDAVNIVQLKDIFSI